MQIALVGLGKMGANMARRLMQGGHEVVVYDLDREAVDALESEGAVGATDLADLATRLEAPRAVWVMVPCGDPTEAVIRDLVQVLGPDDVIIDGGNAHYKDDVRRAGELAESGLHYVDVGTSGGVWGLERGYCLMIGASEAIWNRLRPVFATLAPGRGDIEATPGRRAGASTAEEGYLHCGPPGAGHFVKMIHNGIEYGMMQAYAEGFDILRAQGGESVEESLRLSLDVGEIAEVWRRGSVVTSWLLDLTASALAKSPELDEYSGHVSDSGEGRWTVEAAVESGTPAEVLTSSLYTRFRSRKSHTFAEKILSAMRAGFGGHQEPR
ncbi:MAG: decarboxylating 6-phosphogluconate dehydrogenase [bacterium]|nr:decarboxylating 6-phosphogluconate dehydrogenase [bacterium]